MTEEEQRQALTYQGEPIFSWTVDEYERHERGPVWYAIAFVVGVSLILYAMITQNFLFAVIIIMAGVIIGLSTLREPRRVLFQMTTRGVGLGREFLPYKDLKSFWILYEPPHLKNLYIDFRNPITPHLKISLEEQDPVEIRASLLSFLREEPNQEQESLADLLGRVLKL